jgi:DoxX-like protein
MPGKLSYRVGVTLTVLPVLFLIFDGVIKLLDLDMVRQSMAELGYPAGIAVWIGLLELACLVLYVVPRTSVMGAVLLTGYLGGAIATHVRVGNPLFSHVLFPTYIAAMLWGGLFLRDERLRVLLPIRHTA